MEEIATAFRPDLATGLTAEQVADRVARGDVNDVPPSPSRTVVQIFRANVLTRFNAIMGTLFVVVVLVAPLQDAVFGLIVLFNTSIGIVQELRAKWMLDHLALLGEAGARVRRDGEERDAHPSEVVLDDLLILGPGDKVVVDGEVRDSGGLEVDESLLTGESESVHKSVGDPVLSGTFVVAGSGVCQATRVGREAYAAELADQARRFSLASSDLMTGINHFLKVVSWLMIPTAAVLVGSQLAADQTLHEALAGSVAGVVTLLPEGLVLLTSMAFAVGVVRLGRRRVLVQELPAIEGLARVDVVCTDKTGTLTESRIAVSGLVVADGSTESEATGALAALGALQAESSTSLAAVSRRWPHAPLHDVVESVPFSSERRWSGARFDRGPAWLIGAPEVVLADGDPLVTRARELAESGRRVLALARSDDATLSEERLPGTRCAVALVALDQPVRPDAADTLRFFADQGVRVVVLSGDNPATVGAISRQVGLPGADDPLDARDLPADDRRLGEVLERAGAIGRVDPHAKRRFVAVLQARGHTVAMTGDGVNDVLALKDADLGIAMGSGADATRAVARVVLLDDRFADLPAVVAEGRRVLGNIERVSKLFLSKTIYAFTMALAIGLTGMVFPFLPRHLTLVSTLTIGVPAFFLALEPNTARVRPHFVPRVLRFAVPCGLVAAAASFTAYDLALDDGELLRPQARTAAVVALFLVAMWITVIVARPLNLWRTALVSSMYAAMLVALFEPWIAEFFALYPTVAGMTAAAVCGGVGMVVLEAGRGILGYALHRHAEQTL